MGDCARIETRMIEGKPDGRGVFDKSVVDAWFPSIYDCLRDIAEQRLRYETPGHTLQPTALVHDAYVRLAEYEPSAWQDRTHFFAVAARALREVLVDHARRRLAIKRGRGWCRVTLQEAVDTTGAGAVDIVSLDDALDRLATYHGRPARVVELRFFGGLTIEETAMLLEVSVGTVKADWRFARAWLSDELDEAA